MNLIAKSLWRAVIKLSYDGGLAIASNVALSLLLSLFPFLMLLAALVRLYGDPALATEAIDLVLGHWPADSAKPIEATIQTLLQQPPGEFFSVGTFVALLLATNGIENARDGLNRAYKVQETRSFFWRRLQGAIFVIVGALGLIGAAFILVATPLVWDFLNQRIEWLYRFQPIATGVQYSLAIAILGIVLYSFHRFLPDVRYSRRNIVWGIALTILGILVGSKLFGLYLQNIANYTALYAGLAGMMIAIVYLYCISVLILFGAEFNTALAELRKENAQEAQQTDIEKDDA
ncbi:MAG: YihY/virulence factor BrkB family protein [Pseudomonadota bacterium]